MTSAFNRRTFLAHVMLLTGSMLTMFKSGVAAGRKNVMTVNGPIDPADMGQTLIHEHILVDFIGAEEINPPRWDRDQVIAKVLPFLEEAKNAGCKTFVDCTPNYLGRDVVLLK